MLLCVNQTCQRSSCRHVSVQLSVVAALAVSLYSSQCESTVLMLGNLWMLLSNLSLCLYSGFTSAAASKQRCSMTCPSHSEHTLQVIMLFHARFCHSVPTVWGRGVKGEGTVQGAPSIRVYRSICELAIRLEGCAG